jgi:hypothetical protein
LVGDDVDWQIHISHLQFVCDKSLLIVLNVLEIMVDVAFALNFKIGRIPFIY